MESPVLAAIRQLLNSADIPFREINHEPTFTSEESARVRGEELKHGGKALLIKMDDQFRLFVLPADRKLDSAALRNELQVKKHRFATKEELAELTQLVPGSVPPFGKPILPFDLYVDAAIELNSRIAFNAGSLTDSIVLAVPDYLRVAQPARIFTFSVCN